MYVGCFFHKAFFSLCPFANKLTKIFISKPGADHTKDSAKFLKSCFHTCNLFNNCSFKMAAK